MCDCNKQKEDNEFPVKREIWMKFFSSNCLLWIFAAGIKAIVCLKNYCLSEAWGKSMW